MTCLQWQFSQEGHSWKESGRLARACKARREQDEASPPRATPAGTPAEEAPVREALPARGKVSKEKPRPRVKVSTPKDRKNKNEKKVRSVPQAKKKDKDNKERRRRRRREETSSPTPVREKLIRDHAPRIPRAMGNLERRDAAKATLHARW